MNDLPNYAHLIKINGQENRLEIYRLMPDGRQDLFTYVDLPQIDINKEKFSDFARLLGENILLDSPAFRKLIGF